MQGIQINIRQLRDITLAEDGNSATFGGGVFNDDVVNALAARGKASGITKVGIQYDVTLLTRAVC